MHCGLSFRFGFDRPIRSSFSQSGIARKCYFISVSLVLPDKAKMGAAKWKMCDFFMLMASMRSGDAPGNPGASQAARSAVETRVLV